MYLPIRATRTRERQQSLLWRHEDEQSEGMMVESYRVAARVWSGTNEASGATTFRLEAKRIRMDGLANVLALFDRGEDIDKNGIIGWKRR